MTVSADITQSRQVKLAGFGRARAPSLPLICNWLASKNRSGGAAHSAFSLPSLCKDVEDKHLLAQSTTVTLSQDRKSDEETSNDSMRGY